MPCTHLLIVIWITCSFIACGGAGEDSSDANPAQANAMSNQADDSDADVDAGAGVDAGTSGDAGTEGTDADGDTGAAIGTGGNEETGGSAAAAGIGGDTSTGGDSGSGGHTVATGCGNGIIDTDESCDDQNEDELDGCLSTCTLASCGNGVVDTGEDCDDEDLGPVCNERCRLSDHFVSQWLISETNLTLSLPLRFEGQGVQFRYDFTVDWGDGTQNEVTSFNDEDSVHTYTEPGLYTVVISGLMESFQVGAEQRQQLHSVPNLGRVGWRDLHQAFLACGSLTEVIGGDVSQVVDMSQMFSDASKVKIDTRTWDTRNVVDMSGMFSDASIADPRMSDWQLDAARSLENAFTNSGLTTLNYTNFLLKLGATDPLQPNVTLSGGPLYLPAAQAARDRLISTWNWTIEDAGSCNDLTNIYSAVPAPAAHPPFGGSLFVDPNIVLDDDPSSYQGFTYQGTGERIMYDRRTVAFETYRPHLYDTQFGTDKIVEFQVNPEFDETEARLLVEVYGHAIGQIPGFLFRDLQTVWIHRGNNAFGGGNNNLLIHTEQGNAYMADGLLGEVFLHEGVHTSIDAYHKNDPDWLLAQEKDGNAISDYARDYPFREDLAETIPLYLAARYYPHRISTELMTTIKQTIPNRMLYLDCLGLSPDILK